MKNNKFIYGPVPSRRLGLSIGISPLPGKSCNFSCVYCQLGRTEKFTPIRKNFYKCDDIVAEFKEYIDSIDSEFDVVTIVGEGEPTLYSDLKNLILSVKKFTKKPVCLITNSSLLWDESVQNALMEADIILPSFDFIDDKSLLKIHRPSRGYNFEKIYNGLVDFSNKFQGEIWLEYMLIKDINDSVEYIDRYLELLAHIRYTRFYVNIPVRPPAESWVTVPDAETLEMAVEKLNATSIDMLVSSGFESCSKDPLQAICDIIKRHPMNQHEIMGFLASRNKSDFKDFFKKLENIPEVHRVDYMGFSTYRYV